MFCTVATHGKRAPFIAFVLTLPRARQCSENSASKTLLLIQNERFTNLETINCALSFFFPSAYKLTWFYLKKEAQCYFLQPKSERS